MCVYTKKIETAQTQVFKAQVDKAGGRDVDSLLYKQTHNLLFKEVYSVKLTARFHF